MWSRNSKSAIIIIMIAIISIITIVAIWPIFGKNDEIRQIEKIEKSANEVYKKLEEEKIKITLSNIKKELDEQGYIIKEIITGDVLKGITVDETIMIKTSEPTEVEVLFEEDENVYKYYAIINEKFYKMSLTDGGVVIARDEQLEIETSIEPKEYNYEYKIMSSNLNIDAKVEDNKIFLSSKMAGATGIINVQYGEFETQFTAKVWVKPSETAEADPNLKIETNYGVVDVVWLDKNNNVIKEPLNPVSYLKDMKKVTWTYNKKNKEWTEDEEASEEWYNYSISEDKKDEKQSKWANAKLVKNDVASYFVWIPRYAYRITYYKDKELKKETGYYDGYGMWSADSAKKKYNLEEDIQTVTYNDNKYIVHPAFVNESENKIKYNNGGWDKELAGIWVAKYEMSGNKEQINSTPNQQSLRNMTIGEQYTLAINYRTNYSSHLMKNSEWGAVVYLAQSQYGRNGHEIDINNSDSYITGNGGGITSKTEVTTEGNSYNTEKGEKASTTGNIYGIYDLVGGTAERVSAFNNMDEADLLNTSEWTNATGLTTGKESTKYATKYYSTESDINEEFSSGKIGDATKEVNTGANSTLAHWLGCKSTFISPKNPFIIRGGGIKENPRSSIGIFYSNGTNGQKNEDEGFRVVLCP